MSLSIPQSLASLDHSAFDAQLVSTWQPSYPWTTSKLPEDPKITTGDYVAWTKYQLAEALKGDPRLKNYRFDDAERQVLSYVAFELARWSLHTVHLRQMGIRQMAAQLRRDFARCLNDGELLTIDVRSPLYGQGQMRHLAADQTGFALPLYSRFDRNLLQVLAGGTPHDLAASALPRVEEWLQKDPLSFLAHLDRGAIHVSQEKWRQNMWTYLDQAHGLALDSEATLTPRLRESILEESIDAMADVMPTPIVSDTLEAAIAEEVFRRQQAAQYSALDHGQLKGLYGRRTHMRLMHELSKDVLVKRLVDWDVRAGDLPKVAILDQSPQDDRGIDAFTTASLADCLVPLLVQPASAERDAKILQRLVIPEYHILVCAQKMLSFLLEEEGKRPMEPEALKADHLSRLSILPLEEDIPTEQADEMEQTSRALKEAHDVLMRAYKAVGVNHAYRPIAVILDFIISATSGRVDIRRHRSMI